MTDQEERNAEAVMDRLRLFVSLRALSEGQFDPDALTTVQGELERLEHALAGKGAAIEPFRLAQEDLDHLCLLNARQSLEPEGKIQRCAPLRWTYRLLGRLLFALQRRYNQSVTHLIRRLYASALLTRYYQLRSLALEQRLEAVEDRLARIDASRSGSPPSAPPTSGREAAP